MTTLAAEADAPTFARTLVDENLAACVSILPPMTSVYRWKNAVEEAREQQLLIKTTAHRIPALQDRFRSLHPYELPEFIVMTPDDVAQLYAAWVAEAVRPILNDES
jgi:periplasmic divalent cation tolerance protein